MIIDTFEACFCVDRKLLCAQVMGPIDAHCVHLNTERSPIHPLAGANHLKRKYENSPIRLVDEDTRPYANVSVVRDAIDLCARNPKRKENGKNSRPPHKSLLPELASVLWKKYCIITAHLPASNYINVVSVLHVYCVAPRSAAPFRYIPFVVLFRHKEIREAASNVAANAHTSSRARPLWCGACELTRAF